MKNWEWTAGVCAACVLTGYGYGQTITVEQRTSGGSVVSSDTYVTGTPINLQTIGDTVARINIFSTSTLVAVPKVILAIPASRDTLVSLYITSGDVSGLGDSTSPAAATNFGGLEVTGNSDLIRFACAITGDVTGPISVGQVRRLQVGGLVQGDIDATQAYAPDNVSIGVMNIGALDAIVTAGNGLGTIDVLGSGPVWSGEVAVLQGGVERLSIPFGTMGPLPGTQNDAFGVISAGAIRRFEVQDVATNVYVISDNLGNSTHTEEVVVAGAMSGNMSFGTIGQLEGTIDVVTMYGQLQGPFVAKRINGDVRLLQGGNTNSSFKISDRIDGNVWCDGYLDRFDARAVSANPLGLYSLGQLVFTGGVREFRTYIAGAAVQAPFIQNVMCELELLGSISGVNGNTPCHATDVELNHLTMHQAILNPNPMWLADCHRFVVHSDVHVANDPDYPRPIMQFDKLDATGTYVVAGRFGADLAIEQASGLHGTLLVNANLCVPTAVQAWPEVPVVPQQLQAGSNAQHLPSVGAVELSPMPFYSQTTDLVGGGYLAVLPYGLSENMCLPVDGAMGVDRITSTAFNREANDGCLSDEVVKLHFYGPVQIANPALYAVKVTYHTTLGDQIDVTRRVVASVNPLNSRELILQGRPGYPLPRGVYTVTNASSGNLVCNSIPGVGFACWDRLPVSPFEYLFELATDCSPAPDCEPDDDNTSCDVPPNTICDPIDFNNDGSSFDPQDIDAFLSVYSEGPCIPANATCNNIDFNYDGSLYDPCDIDSFMLVYSEGPCTPCGV